MGKLLEPDVVNTAREFHESRGAMFKGAYTKDYTYVGFDIETYLIQPGLLAPRMVCASFAVGKGEPAPQKSWLATREEALDYLEANIANRKFVWIAHNGVFDFFICAVHRPHLLPEIINAYESGRIRCTRIRQKLIDIAYGEHKWHTDVWTGKRAKTSYGLDQLVWRHFQTKIDKKNPWRLRFGELDGKPISEYPKEAYDYALEDAVWAYLVFFSQEGTMVASDEEMAGLRPRILPNEVEQVAAGLALHGMSVWGLRTDPKEVANLKTRLDNTIANVSQDLMETGLIRKDGSRNMAMIHERVRAVYDQVQEACPTTPTGKPQTTAEVLAFCAQFDPVLGKLELLQESSYVKSNWLSPLTQGTLHALNPPFNSLVETGRTSCGSGESGSFNIQNPPRAGGVRECFIPRAGFVYVSCDYDTLELRTLAQVCYTLFGYSKMREALIAGQDLHSAFAAEMMGVTYDEFMKRLAAGDQIAEEMRQMAKPANFGFPGGMAGPSFAAYAKGYGVNIEIWKAKRMREDWFAKWVEMNDYFRHINQIANSNVPYVEQLFSGRVRGDVKYTQAANSYFQGLAADGAKDALWHVFKECYVKHPYDRRDFSPTPYRMAQEYAEQFNPKWTSPLYGCRPVAFLHDEIIIEARNDEARPEVAFAAAQRLKDVMIERMQTWMPDVPAKASPVMMRRWYKGAKPAFVEQDGRKIMVPSKPVKEEKDGKKSTKWVADLAA